MHGIINQPHGCHREDFIAQKSTVNLISDKILLKVTQPLPLLFEEKIIELRHKKHKAEILKDSLDTITTVNNHFMNIIIILV